MKLTNHSVLYKYKNDVVEINGLIYVREGSDTYKKMLKDGYIKD